MAAFTFGSVFTTWVASPVGIGLSVALVASYGAGIVAGARRGAGVPVLRALVFLVLGVGSLLLAADGGLAAYRDTSFPAAAAQSAVLAAITPISLALGDPVGVVRRALGEERARPVLRVLSGKVARVVMFPLLASVVATALHLLLFVTPWLAESLAHAWVRELTYLVLLGTGLLFVMPLLADELVPAWCTPPLRALIGFADGLLDAVPGVVVMASPALLGAPVAAYLAAADPMYQQRVGGTAMFAIAECVGLPLLAATVVAWVRYDAKEAAAVDAALDAERLRRRAAAVADGAVLDGVAADGAVTRDVEAELDRPWWETDPRFTRRAPHGGGPAGATDT